MVFSHQNIITVLLVKEIKEKWEKDKSEEFSRLKREYEEKYASEIQMKQIELQKKEQV